MLLIWAPYRRIQDVKRRRHEVIVTLSWRLETTVLTVSSLSPGGSRSAVERLKPLLAS